MSPPKLDSRALLRNAGLTPKKSFGQNFLVEGAVVEAIADVCILPSERQRARVVELGAGVGALTAALLERAEHVTAVERDRDLIPVLGRAFAGAIERGSLNLIEGDAQVVDPAALFAGVAPGAPRILCGNLPYQITGVLLQLAVTHARSIDRAVFMVQDEVASRLIAAPGTKEYGALTVFTRAAMDVVRVRTVSRGCFHPSPDVTSAVVRMTPRPLAEETPTFRALVRAAFGARRKTLRNAWRAGFDAAEVAAAATAAGVSLEARGETLDVGAFARVAAALDAQRPSPLAGSSPVRA